MIDEELIEFFLDEASDYMSLWEKHCLEIIHDENSSASVDSLFRVAHNLKGSSRTLGFNEFGNAIHKVEDLIVSLREGQTAVTSEVSSFLLDCYNFFFSWLKRLASEPRHSPNIEKLFFQVECFLNNEEAEKSQEISSEISSENLEHSKECEAVNNEPVKKTKKKSSGSVRVRSEKLDRLIQLIGELSISQSIAGESIKREDVDESTISAIRQTSKLAKEIQSEALSLRLSDLGPLFQRLERTAIEISKTLEKDINLTIDGKSCELDKQAIEAITDPLIHIVRNAVDHGIETPEEREAAGKNREAKVFLGAKSDAEGVMITVKDDGKGLDADKILRKAIDSGIADREKKYSQDEIYSFLFKPGFSTAAEITDISGRGVGLDVVRQSIEEVGGKISIQSEVGVGSEFTFFVPLNINIIEAVIAEVGEERVVLPLSEITETVSLSENEANATEGSNVFCRRGEVIPLVSSSRTLKIENNVSNEKTVVVVRKNGQSIAFAVNRVLGQQSIIIKEIHGNEKRSSFISGATVLGDGKPGIILRLLEIVNSTTNQMTLNGACA